MREGWKGVRGGDEGVEKRYEKVEREDEKRGGKKLRERMRRGMRKLRERMRRGDERS